MEFQVYGVPVPQGSKTPVKNKQGRIVGSREANDKTLRPWRQELADAARRMASIAGCLDGPIRLRVTFRFPMPASAPKRARDRGWRMKWVMPDQDKLVRAIGDGLKAGGLIKDDARICDTRMRKIEVWDDWTGAEIALWRLSEDGEPVPDELGGF